MTGGWRPAAALETLRLRARWLKTIRAFFDVRGVLEVETPVLGPATVTDLHIESLRARLGGREMFLQTSPEFYMKRLLAAGSGPIYQLGRAFRGDERGDLHSPEFTLLEWYRPGFDQYRLMREVGELVAQLRRAGDDGDDDNNKDGDIEITPYRELFLRHTDIDPFTRDWQALSEWCRAHRHDCPIAREDGWDAALDWLLATVIGPRMRGLRFINDYPAGQAALARLDPDNPTTARRFELFIDGVEIANGFEELTDADEQQRRFAADNARRRASGRRAAPVDEHLLAALRHGMPETAGVALGLDRLLRWHCAADSVREVMAFAV